MTPSPSMSRLRHWAVKGASLLVVGLVFSLAYDWAVPRLYRAEVRAGFWLGTTHGALMPVALPSLVLGRDVPIFAERNSGRFYKIGYIAGINVCGLIFFGLAFRKSSPPQDPRPPAPQ